MDHCTLAYKPFAYKITIVAYKRQEREYRHLPFLTPPFQVPGHKSFIACLCIAALGFS